MTTVLEKFVAEPTADKLEFKPAYTFNIRVVGIKNTEIHIWINDLNDFSSRRLDEKLLMMIDDNADHPNSSIIYDLVIIFLGTQESIDKLKTIIDNRKKWLASDSPRIKRRVANNTATQAQGKMPRFSPATKSK